MKLVCYGYGLLICHASMLFLVEAVNLLEFSLMALSIDIEHLNNPLLAINYDDTCLDPFIIEVQVRSDCP